MVDENNEKKDNSENLNNEKKDNSENLNNEKKDNSENLNNEKKDNSENLNNDKNKKEIKTDESNNKISKESNYKNKEIKQDSSDEINLIDRVRENPWMVISFILGLLIIIFFARDLFSGSGNVITGNIVSEEIAGNKLIDFAKLTVQGDVELVNVSKFNEYLYEVSIIISGQELSVFVTSDGKYLVSSLMPLDLPLESDSSASKESQEEKEIPKSDKPSVDLFIMTHCPFGTQAEKGFIPVIEALDNSIIANIRFVHYFMHGDIERDETYRQICIREEQSNKYLDYLKCFLEGDGNADSSGYIANGNNPDFCLKKSGIDLNKLNLCLNSNKSKEYYELDSKLSESYGVQGSPTLIINGVEASSGRDSSSYLKIICSSFNKNIDKCDLVLSSETPQPGFGWDLTGSPTNAQC
jgi:hypothetical protein